MTILKEIKNLYQFFEDNKIDINVDFLELENAEKAILQMTAFNNVVMMSKLSSEEISAVIPFLKGREDSIASYILDILLTNPSFLQNEKVKDVFHKEIEEKIFEDIEDFNLSGNKLKIIDCFLNKDYKSVKPLLDSLDEEDKIDVLMYIMEHTYSVDALNAETGIGAILSEHADLIKSIYEDVNLVNQGFDIEFEGEE